MDRPISLNGPISYKSILFLVVALILVSRAYADIQAAVCDPACDLSTQYCDPITLGCEQLLTDICNGSCDLSTQYCDNIAVSPTFGQCITNMQGCTDDQYCSDLDPFTPYCEQATGDCIQCRTSGDCVTEEACDSTGACTYVGMCSIDADCLSGETCDTDSKTCIPCTVDCGNNSSSSGSSGGSSAGSGGRSGSSGGGSSGSGGYIGIIPTPNPAIIQHSIGSSEGGDEQPIVQTVDKTVVAVNEATNNLSVGTESNTSNHSLENTQIPITDYIWPAIFFVVIVSISVYSIAKIKSGSKGNEMQKRLKLWIAKEESVGYTPEQLRKFLLQKGYNAKDVDKALKK